VEPTVPGWHLKKKRFRLLALFRGNFAIFAVFGFDMPLSPKRGRKILTERDLSICLNVILMRAHVNGFNVFWDL
jgi:hypothetical protein